jgi:hypothetical protein
MENYTRCQKLLLERKGNSLITFILKSIKKVLYNTLNKNIKGNVLNCKTNLNLLLFISLLGAPILFGQTTLTSRATGNWNANDTWISSNLTGTITTSSSSATVTGTGTNFTGQLSVGAALYKTDGTALIGTIASINSATSITLTVNALNNNSGINFKVRKMPGALDTAIILKDNVVVTIPSGIIATCATLEIGSSGSSSSENLTFANSTSSLWVSGNVSVFGPTSRNTREIRLNSGTMTVGGNIALGTGQNGRQDNRVTRLTITFGTISVSGNLTFNNISESDPIQTQIDMSGGAGVFNLGGAFTINNNSGTLLPGTSSTFNFNGSVAQTIPIGVSNVDYNNINSNNTNSGGATLSAAILTNNVSGSISIGSINSGSLLNTANYAITLNNSDGITIANNSTFNAGTSVVSFGMSGFATINGTFQTANANGFSGATSTALKSNNSPTITLGSNSTIEYNSSGNQTVTTRSDYANLTLSNSGTKSLLASLNISGNIDISGSAKALLPNNSYSSASTITFNKILQPAIGSWGSTTSIASNKTDIRFLTGYSGLLGKPCSVTNANANTDQTNCNNSTFTLAGNTVATSGETGTWSFFNGTGTITNVNSPTTTVVITGTTATLRWTIMKTEGCYSFNDVVLTNNASPTIANANSDQIKCNTGTFTLAGNAASIGIGNWTVILGTATITTPSSNISGVTGVSSGTSATLRWTISNGNCVSTDDVVLTNSTASVAGSVSGGTAICNGSTSPLLTLTGYSGTITKWQSAVSPFTSWTNIVTTASTYTSGALSATTQYRAVVQTGSCTAVNSISTNVSVNPTSVGGSVTGGTTICSGNTSALLTLSGYTGTITKWQTAISPFTTWTDIVNTATTYTSEALTATTQFRAVVQSGSCTSANSSVTTVTVIPLSNGGTVTGGTTICSGNTSALLTLSGYTGSVTKWQSAISPFTTWTDIANTTTTYTSGALTAITQFRAVVQSGSCTAANSAVTTVTVNPTSIAGSITGSTTVCPATNGALLTLSGNTGTIQWQTAPDNSSFSNIDLATGSTYTASNLTATAYYRAMVTSGVCPSINSESATISIKTTTFNGVSWDNGNPSATTSIVYNFIGNYTLPDTISACSCTVSLGNVTVPTGKSMTLLDKLTVTNGSLTFENNANLIQTNSVSNSGNITVKRNSGLQVRLDHTLWSSPVSNVNLYGFSPFTLTNRFYSYSTLTNTYVTTGLSAASTFTVGQGYAIRAPNTFPSIPQTWEGSFTGVPNNGTVPFASETIGAGYNLVGNPYPSPIDAVSFVSGNPAINGNLYFYAHTLSLGATGLYPEGTNYAVWNSLGSTASTQGTSGVPALVPNGIIQVGQGFIVRAINSGAINFTNSMRVGNTENQFFRNSTTIERHRLWLNLSNVTGIEINQILVGYIEGATSGYDANYDALSFGNSGSYLSSKIDGLNYTIQGRALPFFENDIVPLGFKAALAGNYSISLSAMDGMFLGDQPVYILDTATNTVHDIKTSAFTFYSEMGVFDNRFQIVYTQVLGNNIPTFNSNSVITYKKDGVIYVASTGIQLKEIEVYDVTGRLVFKESNINSTLGILSQMKASNEVLLLKIISNDNQTISRKLIN